MAGAALYDYPRSSASYRVRIALNLLGVGYETIAIDLPSGEHRRPEHQARHPLGLVPVLEIDGLRLTQSLAIIEYLNETRAAGLLPQDPAERARLRALAMIIAVDTHPVCNLSVAARATQQAQQPQEARSAWMQRFIRRGLAAFERSLNDLETGPFCHGAAPGLADICLVPQLYNARRWAVDIADLSAIKAVAMACNQIEAFQAAAPTGD